MFQKRGAFWFNQHIERVRSALDNLLATVGSDVHQVMQSWCLLAHVCTLVVWTQSPSFWACLVEDKSSLHAL